VTGDLPGEEDSGETWVVSNEFAFVHVSMVTVGNGQRLQISSPSRDTSILLDSVVLEAMTTATPEDLSAFVTRDQDR
jgi:hypothetical protein